MWIQVFKKNQTSEITGLLFHVNRSSTYDVFAVGTSEHMLAASKNGEEERRMVFINFRSAFTRCQYVKIPSRHLKTIKDWFCS